MDRHAAKLASADAAGDQMTNPRLMALWHWLQARHRVAIALAMVGVALLVFANLAEDVLERQIDPIDIWGFTLLAQLRSPGMTALALFLSGVVLFPYVMFLVAPFAGYLLATRRWITGITILVVPLLTGGLVELLKRIFARPRPPHELIPVMGLSFPSGHATGSTVLYGLLGYVAWRYLVRPRWARGLVILGSILLILATGLSRVYLQVHYPTDVIAGWAAGTCILAATIIFLEAHRGR